MHYYALCILIKDRGEFGVMEEIIKVVYPLGIQSAHEKDVAASLDDLNGKTIGELWNYGFRGDETFPLIRNKIREGYPDARFVHYEDFGNFHDASDAAAVLDGLPARLKALGCDAVIVGNGC